MDAHITPEDIVPPETQSASAAKRRGIFQWYADQREMKIGLLIASRIASLHPAGLELATADVLIDGIEAKALMDSEATDSFINREFMFSNHMKSEPCLQNILMATKSLSAEILGVVKSNIKYGGRRAVTFGQAQSV